MGKSTLGFEVKRIHLASIGTDLKDNSGSDLKTHYKQILPKLNIKKL